MAVEGAPAVAGGAGAPAALVRALQRVLDSGTGDAVDIKEGGRIRLVNEVAVFVAALLVPYAGVFVLIHGWRNAAIQVIAIVALLGVVVLNRVGWCGFARAATVLIGNALVFEMTLRLGLDSGAQLYIFAAIIAPLLFYPGREWRYIVPLVALTVAGSLTCDVWSTLHAPIDPLPASVLPWFHWTSVIGSLVTVFAFVLYFYIELEVFEASLVEAHRKMSALAETDGLTGVANRRKLEQVLQMEWARAIRGKHPLSIVMIDVDHFKRYNDSYGHQAGDAVLRRIGDALRDAVLRPFDLVGRYGGEEFMMVLAETDLEGARLVAERARARVLALAGPHVDRSEPGRITCSLGVATARFVDDNVSALVRRADAALYAAKAAGRNCVRCDDSAVAR